MRLRRRVALAALAAALAVPAVAATGSVAAPLGQIGDGGPRLMVTFGDRPTMAQARDRLEGLGEVGPLVPEAGVYALTPRSPGSARAAALSRTGVRRAEWSLERTTDEVTRANEPPPPPVALVAPPPSTDPLFTPGQQWHLFHGTWTTTLTGTSARPRIAVLDGGVDVTHEEWRGAGSPLVAPRSTYRGAGDANDWGRTGHGTHVAGIAAAPANGVGVLGVAPSAAGAAEVVPVQIADREGRSTDETMMKGIRWAVNNGARVINISAGGPGYSQAFQDTVNWAFAHGALIIASVGNEGEEGNVLNYPAAYDHVLGVAAQCDGDPSPPECPSPYGLARFSNHNRSVDIVAPGVNILSSVPRRIEDRSVQPGYALKDGTSMAAPFVSGVAALVFGANPGATPYQVMRQLQNTATDMGRAGRDDSTGDGLVNPAAAVTYNLPADDVQEINDDVRNVARAGAFQTAALPAVVRATVDHYNDPVDIYPVRLTAGQSIRVRVSAPKGALGLAVWGPGTRTVFTDDRDEVARHRLAASARRGRSQTVSITAERTGRHYVEVAALAGQGLYRLEVIRS